MKSLISTIMFLLAAINSYAGEWIEVDGGKFEIDLQQQEIEEQLWRYLEAQSDFVFQDKASYTYQYQARTKSEVYINAFCDSFSKQNLHQEFLVVMDGGSCFFQATYNLETGQFVLLYVNGLA